MLPVFVLSSLAMKVTVMGGTGFVGSRVCKQCVAAGAEVTSVSQSGTVPAWAAGESWASEVTWVANELTRGSREALEAAVGSPDVVVSCVGAVGFDVQGLMLGNGVANAEAAAAAKKAGVSKFVFVSVASEVADAKGWLPGFFGGYFDGKEKARAAIVEAVGTEGATFVQPTFIYGGDSFGLFPPRVNSAYGAGVEELLSLPVFRKLADITPGLIKVALRPPVSVDAVAGACTAAALGKVGAGALDGTDAINEAAGASTPTAISEWFDGLKEKLADGAA